MTPPSTDVSLLEIQDVAAVRLFLQRAQAVAPNFKLSNENVEVIAAICRHLDGLPLTLELAAARIRNFSPTQLAKRLQSPMNILVNGRHNLA